MGSASNYTKIIEHFLATSADYLGVSMHAQRVDNCDALVTAYTPKRFSVDRNGNQKLSPQREMDNA